MIYVDRNIKPSPDKQLKWRDHVTPLSCEYYALISAAEKHHSSL